MPRKKSLPHHVIAIPNPDKGFHESVDKLEKDRADLPHPFRILMCGQPNCGKTTLALNLILHQTKPFERIVVWHTDPGTSEYELVTDEIVEEAPQLEDFDKEKKNLVVIDDVALRGLGKDEKWRLDRLLGNWSTHSNISVVVTSQQPNAIPANIRRQCNSYVLWKSTDMQSLKDIALKCGCEAADLRKYFHHLKTPKDSLLIDLTGFHSKYRKNLFQDLG